MHYRIAAILLATASLSAACASDGGSLSKREVWDGRRADNQSNFRSRLLNAHNAERQRLGMMPLVWDDTLAQHAQAWSAELARRGAFEHSPANQRPGEGENLFTGTADAYTLEAMIGGFIGEKKDFRPGTFPNVSQTGRWSDVSHYTQIIWRSTTRVGCGLATRNGRDWLTCRYSPPGNVVGVKVP